jgi:hypothetical protein
MSSLSLDQPQSQTQSQTPGYNSHHLKHHLKDIIIRDNVEQLIQYYHFSQDVPYYEHPFCMCCQFNAVRCLIWIFQNDKTIFTPITKRVSYKYIHSIVSADNASQDMDMSDTYRIIEYAFETACTYGCIHAINFIASKNILYLKDEETNQNTLIRMIITHMTVNYTYVPKHKIIHELFRNFSREQLNLKRSELLYKGIVLSDPSIVKIALSLKYDHVFIPENQYNGGSDVISDEINFIMSVRINDQKWNSIKDDIIMKLVYYGYYKINKLNHDLTLGDYYNSLYKTRKQEIYNTLLQLFIRTGYDPRSLQSLERSQTQSPSQTPSSTQTHPGLEYYNTVNNMKKKLIANSIHTILNSSNTYKDTKNINIEYTILPLVSRYV